MPQPPIDFCERASGVTFFVRTPRGDVVLGTVEKGDDADEAARIIAAVQRLLTLVAAGHVAHELKR